MKDFVQNFKNKYVYDIITTKCLLQFLGTWKNLRTEESGI